MYKYRISTTRTSTDVEFYKNPDEVGAHINNVYIATGILTITEETRDEYILSKVYTFISEEAFNNFKVDPIISQNIQDRKAYESENEILRWKEIL
jgi:hypothetical protein